MDTFTRTTHPSHVERVIKWWKYMQEEKGLIYKSEYSGWYCQADESFLSPDKVCTLRMVSLESNRPVEWITEPVYKFRLSQYGDCILKWLKDSNCLEPEERINDILPILKDEKLNDIAISRPTERIKWGIPVPNDPSQLIYVWFDALIGYLDNNDEMNPKNRNNKDENENENQKRKEKETLLHVIGKDILR